MFKYTWGAATITVITAYDRRLPRKMGTQHCLWTKNILNGEVGSRFCFPDLYGLNKPRLINTMILRDRDIPDGI